MILRSEPAVRIGIVSLVLAVTLSTACDESVGPAKGEPQWAPLGLEDVRTHDLVLERPYLYACTGEDGLYRKDIWKGRGPWRYIGLADSTPGSANPAGVRDLAVLGDGGILVAVASVTPDEETVSTIYRSADGGLTWQRSDSVTAEPATAGAVEARESLTNLELLTRASCGGPVLLAGWESPGGRIYRSVDAGLSWSRTSSYWGEDVQGHRDACAFWCGGMDLRESAFMLKSSDGGLSWDYLGAINEVLAPVNCVLRIAPVPSNADAVYATTCRDSIVKTVDGGQSWEYLPFCGGELWRNRTLVEPHNVSHLFVAAGEVLYESSDGGRSFVTFEVPDGLEILDMEYDDLRGDLYVATDVGIYNFRIR
jgi:hypothetical protein